MWELYRKLNFKKGLLVHEPYQIPRVKLNSFCFELKDGQLVLKAMKESHMYYLYYQIQLQVLATSN